MMLVLRRLQHRGLSSDFLQIDAVELWGLATFSPRRDSLRLACRISFIALVFKLFNFSWRVCQFTGKIFAEGSSQILQCSLAMNTGLSLAFSVLQIDFKIPWWGACKQVIITFGLQALVSNCYLFLESLRSPLPIEISVRCCLINKRW